MSKPDKANRAHKWMSRSASENASAFLSQERYWGWSPVFSNSLTMVTSSSGLTGFSR
jgi:hypothetical protein